MNPRVKRLLMGLAGATTAFIAALGAMEHGTELLISQIGQIPIVSWVAVMGGFITGYLNGENVKNV